MIYMPLRDVHVDEGLSSTEYPNCMHEITGDAWCGYMVVVLWCLSIQQRSSPRFT